MYKIYVCINMFYLNKDHDPERGENILFKILF